MKRGPGVEECTAGDHDGVIHAMAASQIKFARLGQSPRAAAYTATNGGVIAFLTRQKADRTRGHSSVLLTKGDGPFMARTKLFA